MVAGRLDPPSHVADRGRDRDVRPGDAALLGVVGTALSQVRGSKSAAQVSMRTDVASAIVRGPAADLDRLKTASRDLAAAGRIAALDFEPVDAGELTVEVSLS